jgi:hypothetical protein
MKKFLIALIMLGVPVDAANAVENLFIRCTYDLSKASYDAYAKNDSENSELVTSIKDQILHTFDKVENWKFSLYDDSALTNSGVPTTFWYTLSITSPGNLMVYKLDRSGYYNLFPDNMGLLRNKCRQQDVDCYQTVKKFDIQLIDKFENYPPQKNPTGTYRQWAYFQKSLKINRETGFAQYFVTGQTRYYHNGVIEYESWLIRLDGMCEISTDMEQRSVRF